MDLSKLPRLSKTETPTDAGVAAPTAGEQPAPAAAATFCNGCGAPLRPGARFCDSCGAPTYSPSYHTAPDPDVGYGAEAWISIAVGVILLLMQPRLIKFICHKVFGTYFAPYVDADGNEFPYTAQLDFWSDLGLTLFALVLILEGFVLAFARKRMLILIAFALTVLTTVYNLGYLVFTFNAGIAILSAMAVAFGVYIAIYEWRLLQRLKRVRV
jgi:hypothetical protein